MKLNDNRINEINSKNKIKWYRFFWELSI